MQQLLEQCHAPWVDKGKGFALLVVCFNPATLECVL